MTGLCTALRRPMAPTLDRRNQEQHRAQKREYYAQRQRERELQEGKQNQLSNLCLF